MLSSVLVKREGMETLKEIIKKDQQYVEGIKESSVVRNGVRLLGGRKRRNGREKDRKEGEKGSEEGEEEEKGGIIEEMECVEMRVREKILLIELLNELVKGGMEIVEEEEEEEMKEVLMELDEEGNKHVEEEIEGDGEGEEKEEEKREWEELSEKARNLVWVIEKMKNRREGKKSETLKKIRKEKVEMEKKVQEEKEEERVKEKQDLEKKKKREKRMVEELDVLKVDTSIPPPSLTAPSSSSSSSPTTTTAITTTTTTASSSSTPSPSSLSPLTSEVRNDDASEQEIGGLEGCGEVIHDSTTGIYTLVIQIPPVCCFLSSSFMVMVLVLF